MSKLQSPFLLLCFTSVSVDCVCKANRIVATSLCQLNEVLELLKTTIKVRSQVAKLYFHRTQLVAE
jgi:hypothetical protein